MHLQTWFIGNFLRLKLKSKDTNFEQSIILKLFKKCIVLGDAITSISCTSILRQIYNILFKSVKRSWDGFGWHKKMSFHIIKLYIKNKGKFPFGLSYIFYHLILIDLQY